MNKYLKFTLLFVIIIGGINLFSNEKIVDFKFKYNGFYDTRVYLQDKNKKINYGYYSIRPFLNYSENNFILGGMGFNTMSVEDKTIEIYNKKVDTKEILNLAHLYYTYNANLISSIILSSVGFAGSTVGAIFVGLAYYEETKETQQWISTGWFSGGYYNTKKEKFKPYDYLLYPGIGVLAGGGFCFLLGLAVFLPIMIYNYILYKDFKNSILDVLNGIKVSSLDNKEILRIKFSINIL